MNKVLLALLCLSVSCPLWGMDDVVEMDRMDAADRQLLHWEQLYRFDIYNDEEADKKVINFGEELCPYKMGLLVNDDYARKVNWGRRTDNLKNKVGYFLRIREEKIEFIGNLKKKTDALLEEHKNNQQPVPQAIGDSSTTQKAGESKQPVLKANRAETPLESPSHTKS